MLTAKAIKATIVLDPAEVLALAVPEAGKAFSTKVRVGGSVVYVPLNAKSLRRVIATIKEAGPENIAVIIQGKLRTDTTLAMEEAGIIATPKAKKEAPAELAAA